MGLDHEGLLYGLEDLTSVLGTGWPSDRTAHGRCRRESAQPLLDCDTQRLTRTERERKPTRQRQQPTRCALALASIR